MLRVTLVTEGMEAVVEKMALASSRAEHILAQQVSKDMTPYEPFLTGAMSNGKRVDRNLIIYTAPYARFLYYGKVMIDPNTGSTWAKAGQSKVVTDRDLVFNTSGHAQAQAFWYEAAKAQNFDKWARVAERAMKNAK